MRTLFLICFLSGITAKAQQNYPDSLLLIIKNGSSSKVKADCYNKLGAHYQNRDYDSSSYHYKKSLEISAELGDSALYYKSTYGFARVLHDKSLFSESNVEYEKGIQYYQRENDDERVAKIKFMT